MGVLLLSIDTVLVYLACLTLDRGVYVAAGAAALSASNSSLEVGSIFGNAVTEL